MDSAPIDIDGLHQIKRFYPESFDYILLDPPCSALGLRPKLTILQKSIKDLQYFVKIQKELIHNAVVLLKPGGILTYSTCTFHFMENEGMVHFLLKEYSNMMELVPIDSPQLGSPGLPGCGLNEYQRNCIRRFDPSDTNDDTIGFFVAKFQKMNINQR